MTTTINNSYLVKVPKILSTWFVHAPIPNIHGDFLLEIGVIYVRGLRENVHF